MLGNYVLTYLGVPQGIWTEWLVSFLFLVLMSLFLRHLIWWCWPTLRKVTAFTISGYRLDIILLLNAAMTFIANMPVPFYGNNFVNGLVKIFFIIMIYRQVEKIIATLLNSRELFPKLPSVLQKRSLTLSRAFLILIGTWVYGADLLPTSFLSSWFGLSIVISVLIASLPALRDAVLGWQVIANLSLEVGQDINTPSSNGMIHGKIIGLHWTHLEVQGDVEGGVKKLIRWKNVY